MKRLPLVFGILFVCCDPTLASAEIINVPEDQPTIQAAIDVALDGDEIIVAPGTYFENINFFGKAITLRSTDPTNPNVVADTIIDGGESGVVIICASDEGADTLLTGLTITGGYGPDGGGMLNLGTSPTITHCTFTENTSKNVWGGGGMLNLLGSHPTISSCTFNNNTTEGGGGGLANALFSSPTIEDCVFTENSASLGGGIGNVACNAPHPTITNSTFTDNTADVNGGGIINLAGCSPAIDGCTFSGNSAVYFGGGIANVICSEPHPMITNCLFASNTVAVFGGGIVNISECHPTVEACAFFGNSAVDGGGLASGEKSNPLVTNCIFVGNSAEGEGGAMMNNTASSPTVVNSTVVGNSAQTSGGGLCGFGTDSNAFVHNCAIFGNTADVDPQAVDLNGAQTTIAYSGIEGGWSGNGSNNMTSDPLFVLNPDPGSDGEWGTDDDDYGDLHLLPGSPLIDAGNNAAVPKGVNTDLDGNPRFVNDPCSDDTGNPDGVHAIADVGAYEFQPTSPTDVDCDGTVGAIDLLDLLASWGLCPGCTADVNRDGVVSVADVLLLLEAWQT